MELADRVAISAEVMARQLGAEMVLLDLASGMYFGLDEVGCRIWQLLEDGRSLAEVRDNVAQEFNADLPTIERDLLDLVLELHSRGLLELR